MTMEDVRTLALFPCGDAMVCIIDDRDEVWNFAPNMIRVKPYIFFDGTADINAPPGLDKGKVDSMENNNVRPKRQVKVLKLPKKKNASVKIDDQYENTTAEIESNSKYKVLNEKVKASSENQPDGCTDDKMSSCMESGRECIEELMDVTEVSSSTEVGTQQPKSSEESIQNEKENVEDNALSNSSQEICAQEDQDKQTKNTEDVKTTESKRNEDCEKANIDIDKSGKNNIDESKLTNNNIKTDNGQDVEYEEVVEWEDDDDYLMYLEEILTRIHTAYYDMYDQIKDKKTVKKEDQPNVKKIIPYVKKKVLQGVNIVFSSVVPTNQPLERSRAYFVAKSLGAEVQTEIKQSGDGEQTTHLVAAKMGTQKVKAAMKYKGIHVVRPEWLWTCNDRWEHVEEMLFLLDENHQYKDARDSPDVLQVKEKIKRKAENDVEVEQQSSDTAKRLFKKAKINLESDSANTDCITEKSGQLGEEISAQFGKEEEMEEIKIDVSNELPSTSGRVRRFSETINPLYSFSSKDFEDMDKEVDEILSGSSSSSEDEDSLSSNKNIKNDNKNDDDENDDELGESKAGEKELRHKVLGHTVDSSSDDSMSGDFPRGWKKKTSPKHEYDDNRHLLEIDDPGEANLALLKAAQSSPHWIFEESSESQDSDADSIGSVDEEMAAAVEKELFR